MVEFIKYKNRKKKKPGIQVTPLIDMVFLLLIFFLLTSYYTKPTIPVSLPEAESAGIHDEPDIIIVVRDDGTLLLEKKVVTTVILPDVLRTLFASGREKKIHIQADTSAHFGIIIRLMDIAYSSGAEDIFFVVEKKGREQ